MNSSTLLKNIQELEELTNEYKNDPEISLLNEAITTIRTDLKTWGKKEDKAPKRLIDLYKIS